MLKKYISFFVLSFYLIFYISSAFALSSSQKWAILDSFNSKEINMIFKSSVNFSEEATLQLMKSANKRSIYENIRNTLEEKRKDLEEKRKWEVQKIYSLQDTLEKLAEDITALVKETNKINAEIIALKEDIKENQKKINILQKKVEATTKTLLEYMVYLYKKWNLYNWEDGQIDNLKAIIMQSENIDKILNDAYYKELMLLTWKKLVDRHRKYILNLYKEKERLRTAVKKSKDLRKKFLLKKWLLEDKKKFQKRLLDVSKWKEVLYRKYIKEKIESEKKFQLKSYAEEIKFQNLSKSVLAKQGCKFIDVKKDKEHLSKLSKKCSDLNKMVYNESKLKWFKNKMPNIFNWPVAPTRWLSSFFHDVGYKKTFWAWHNAIDIPKPQWTDIKAPADWYVIFVLKPVNTWYAYIALKHANWFVTVYGHVSDVSVWMYDFVKDWEVFAKTGWAYGTKWAWYMTSWAHLHFEIIQNKVHVDPVDFLDISVLSFKNIPSRNRIKFYSDYREATWKDFKWWKRAVWKVFVLDWKTEIERQKSLLSKYARSDFNNWNLWVSEAINAKIDPTFMMCIWLAETWLWRHLKTSYNVWNIWNVDSWGVKYMNSPKAWIYAMWRTLNNKYLWHYESIKDLSRYWNTYWTIYASSPDNWHNNIIKCMTAIKWEYVPDNYFFRLD